MKPCRAPRSFERLEDRLLLSAGDSFAEAVRASVVPGIPSTIHDRIDSASDVNFLSLDLSAGQHLAADITVQANGGTVATILRLYDDAGNQLAATDAALGQGVGRLEFVAPQTGRYFLSIERAPSSSTSATTSPDFDIPLIADYDLHLLVSDQTQSSALITGRKWNDINGNGLFDADEPGLSGVMMYLDMNDNGLLDTDEPTTLTGADGRYSFTGIPPASYVVREVIPAGFRQTFAPEGAFGRSTNGGLQLIQPDPLIGGTFRGHADVSTDGLGTDDFGTLQAKIRAGATIEMAFLHVATRTFGDPFRPASILFEGQSVPLAWLDNVGDGEMPNFETGRGNVTDLVRQKVLAGASGDELFDFLVDERGTEHPEWIEGTSLTVIYSHPDLPIRTIAVLEGGLTGPTPQTTHLNFKSPLDPSDEDFLAGLALGFQYGFEGGTQFSTVRVNGVPLTSSAGGSDDSREEVPGDGNLITVGGVGDAPANLALADRLSFDASLDDELYDLKEFIAASTTSLALETANPSGDDSMFLMVLVLPGEADVTVQGIDFGNQPLPPPPSAAISGRKWNDLNGNTLEDPGEPGIAGVIIYLDLNGNQVLDPAEPQATTNASGSYSINNVPPGTYTVRETDQGANLQTFPGSAGGFSHVVIVSVGEAVENVNFGNRQILRPPPPTELPPTPPTVVLIPGGPAAAPLVEGPGGFADRFRIELVRGGGAAPQEIAMRLALQEISAMSFAELAVEEDMDDLLAVLSDAAAPDLLAHDPGDPPEPSKPVKNLPYLPAGQLELPSPPVVATVPWTTSYLIMAATAAAGVLTFGLLWWRLGPKWLRWRRAGAT